VNGRPETAAFDAFFGRSLTVAGLAGLFTATHSSRWPCLALDPFMDPPLANYRLRLLPLTALKEWWMGYSPPTVLTWHPVT